jgi:CBS domain-containing protein
VIEMLKVSDVMTAPVFTVSPDAPLKDVARVLTDNGVSGVPVVGPDRTILGVVSEADFLVKEQGAQVVRHRRLARLLGESEATKAQLEKVGARTAGQAMTAPAVTIEPTRSIHEAAALMTQREVNRLPVVDRGRLVGIVSRADLVRAYLRTDDELVEIVRQDVLRRILWLDPAAFTVEAHDGEVIVRGQVERLSTARMVEEAITMVPGIVSATVDLAWSLDDRDLQPASRDPVFPFGPE